MAQDYCGFDFLFFFFMVALSLVDEELLIVSALPVCGGEVLAAVASGVVAGSVADEVVLSGAVVVDVVLDGAVVVVGWPVFWAIAVPLSNPAARAAQTIGRILILHSLLVGLG